MRKLASIKKIVDIKPIDGADKICAYQVDGWWVVDSVDKYNVGEAVVYLEIDSWVPATLAPFLSKGKEPNAFNGVPGERLKTIKLKGQLSQGLLLPIEVCWEKVELAKFNLFDWQSDWNVDQVVGLDYTEALGIQKWEPPVPACLSGEIKGEFPSFIEKTFQVRVQSLGKELAEWNGKKLKWQVEEKLDGTSATFYIYNYAFGVCSRNLELAENYNNTYWKIAKVNRLEEKLQEYYKNVLPGSRRGRNIAIQGEIIGEGINGNHYGIHGQRLHVFDIYDIDNQEYFLPSERNVFCKKNDLMQVPILQINKSLIGNTIEEIVAMADGASVLTDELGNSPCREGLVLKSMHGYESFKVISNRFLMTGK